MELLSLHRRRSRLSDVAYVALNIGLAIAVLAIAWSTQNVWLPLVVVLIGKWRVFAVRPRFWRQNILASAVDSIVGISHVIFLYAASGQTILQVALTIGFIFWLLFVKPRSKRLFVTAQAGAALFVGVTALSMVAYQYDVFFFVLEGCPTIQIGSEEQEVKANMLVESPKDIVHCLYNHSDKPARILVVKTPKPVTNARLL